MKLVDRHFVKNLFSKEGFYFLICVFLEVGMTVYLIKGRLITIGHDGFHHFSLQYYFLNSAVMHNEIPLWIPFLTHGSTATWWYSIQGASGLLPNILFHIGQWLKDINFLSIYHSGIFVDRLVLLVGTWLLSQKYYSSIWTRFFVSISVVGTCIVMSQLKFTLYLYYALPLILYFLHTFFDTGKWRYLLLGANLFTFQLIGNDAYFIPVLSLVIFLYVVFFVITHFGECKKKLRALQYKKEFIICCVGIIVFLGMMQAIVSAGKDPFIVSFNPGRNVDGTVTLDNFLTYGGNTDLVLWKEVFFRISPALDYTLYMGYLTLPLIMIGCIYNFQRKVLHLVLCTFVYFLFTQATFISILFYYTWPLMKFYRHLALVSPIVKVFLCFLAGFGFEAVFVNGLNNISKKHKIFVMSLVATGFVGLTQVLAAFSVNYNAARHFVYNFIGPQRLPRIYYAFNESFLSSEFRVAAFYALLIAILFGMIPFVRRKRSRGIILTIALILHVLDVYGYRFAQTNIRAFVLNAKQYNVLNFEKIPYRYSRDPQQWAPNPRESILDSTIFHPTLPRYWTYESFLFNDFISTRFRTDHWQQPFDDLIRAFRNQPLGDQSTYPIGYEMNGYKKLRFPQANPVALKVAGYSKDKIQFFANAYPIADDHAVAVLLTHPANKGDILLLSNKEQVPEDFKLKTSWPENWSLQGSERLNLDYDVTNFSSNTIGVDVIVPPHKSAWMYYSDIWHPFWKATVNGKSVPVFKANLAYKAIPLEPGLNQIKLFVQSHTIFFLYCYFGLNALFWLLGVLWLATKIIRSSRMTTEVLGDTKERNQ